VTSVRVCPRDTWETIVALDDNGKLWHGSFVASPPGYWIWRPVNLPDQPLPERRH